MYDSGAGLFVYHTKKWKLAGIAIRAHHGASLFADSHNSAHKNHYVRIYYYKDDIDSIIQNKPKHHTGASSEYRPTHQLAAVCIVLLACTILIRKSKVR